MPATLICQTTRACRQAQVTGSDLLFPTHRHLLPLPIVLWRGEACYLEKENSLGGRPLDEEGTGPAKVG